MDIYSKYINKLEDYEKLFDFDSENIKKGYYRAPYSADLRHRELNPEFVMAEMQDFMRESMENFARKNRKGKKELPLISGLYPEYYMRNFHFQSDGWLSSRSANIYDFSAETFFSGTLDAMQRQVFVPLHFWLKNQDRPYKEMKLLEIGGGTGRLMTFFRDNYPEMDCSLLDLSPFYLDKAKKNDEYFREFFMKNDPRAKNEGFDLKPLKLYQGRAEKMEVFEENTFDIVNCVYLFNELPPD